MILTIVPVDDESHILPQYRGTAVGDLLAYHNLGASHRCHMDAELLIGMCMDNRVHLHIPPNFAFILRCAGANLNMLSFDVSFAIAVGGICTVCLIGHEGCRMVDVASKREAFVSGLIDNVGWDRARAEAHFDNYAARYGFDNVAEFVWREAKRLQDTYEGITVAPLIYSSVDCRLCQITDSCHSSSNLHRAVEADRGA